jgi:DNA-binding response OmpR family regulator
MKILLVEDDKNLSDDLKQQLLLEKFEVDIAFDGLLAERLILRNTYDCILLDVNLPGKNGYEVAKEVRRKNVSTPIIMITAYGEIEDKLSGFEGGADDYITKPFYFKELLARIKVFLKRSQYYAAETNNIAIADLVIDPRKKQVSRAGKPIKLTPREYQIINILVEAGGDPINKKELIRKVWGTTFEANSNTIEVFINMLRSKIDKDFEPKLIKTRIGYGYYMGVD